MAAQVTLPISVVRMAAAAAMIAFGLYWLVRRRHPRWVVMRVGPHDLTVWSFLMASAHGAGLMLPSTTQWWFPVGLHTAGYLLATGALALIVYYKVGIAVLRRAWFNFDLLWIGALVSMGILTMVM